MHTYHDTDTEFYFGPGIGGGGSKPSCAAWETRLAAPR